MSKPSYAVVIMRKDANHIMVLESEDFNVCFDRWEQLSAEWASAVKEVRPFLIKDPIVSVFDPSFVYEITIKPYQEEQNNKNSNNPYYKQMASSGLSSMLNGNDLLGRGKNPY